MPDSMNPEHIDNEVNTYIDFVEDILKSYGDRWRDFATKYPSSVTGTFTPDSVKAAYLRECQAFIDECMRSCDR